MTFYLAAGEMVGWVPSDSTSFESTSSTTFDPNFARNSICSGSSASSYTESATVSLPDDFWFHLDGVENDAGGRTATLAECEVSGTGVFRLLAGPSAVQMQALISSAWTNIGSSVPWALTTRQTFDVHITGNSATGTAKLYVAGTLRETASAVDLSAVVGVTNLRSYGSSSGVGGYKISQAIIADEPTVGMRLLTVVPTGAGATGDWTGDYTSVDEASLNDADFIYSGTNGQVELFTGTAVGSLTGYVIRAVGVYARAKCGAGGPQNLQLALRVNGTTYTSSSKALDVGYGAYGNIWSQNPDTTTDWLGAAIATLQFGVKAIT